MTERKLFNLRLLGGNVLEDEHGSPIKMSSHKGRAMLTYLAVSDGGRATREQLAHLLWGDSTDAQARQSLRQCLIALKKDFGGAAFFPIDQQGGFIRLNAEVVWTDAAEFERLAASDDPAAVERASKLYRGPFLRDFHVDAEEFTAWAEIERQRVHRIAIALKERHIELLDAAGEGRRAIEAAESLIAADPFRDDWQRMLLRLYARYNCREVALRKADEFVALLKSELGAEPESGTRALIEQILRGEYPPAALPNVAELGTGDDFAISAAVPVSSTSRCDQPGRIDRYWRVGAAAATAALLVPILYWASTPLTAPVTGAAKLPQRSGVWILVSRPEVTKFSRAEDAETATRVSFSLSDSLTRFPRYRVISPDLESRAVPDFVVEPNIHEIDGTTQVSVRLVDNKTGRQISLDDISAGTLKNDYRDALRRWTRAIETGIGALLSESGLSEQGRVSQLMAQGRRAQLRGMNKRNHDEALQKFEEALKQDPDSVSAMSSVAGQIIRGHASYMIRKDDDRLAYAEQLIGRAMELQPNDPDILNWRGKIYRLHGELDLALKCFERAVELNPSHVISYAQIGHTLIAMERNEEGVEKLRYAMKLSPRDWQKNRWMVMAAKGQLKLGQFAEVVDMLSTGLQQVSGDPRLHAYLAAAHAALDHFDKAAEHIAKFNELSPAGSIDDFIKRLRSRLPGKRDPRLADALEKVIRPH
jgi:DNA-binding SARP family transcriptional activator/Flp pilus assembly protein TadD